ncbi:MAG TPA: hypothetical protein VLE44_02775 [Candidatus Saccharimonadales bacterium]|nr:hypothetical protein [Candidatus Saccharimonadales bacterium]
MRKFVIGGIIVAILVIGVVVGIILVQQQQIFKQKAAVPTGQATVSVKPETSSLIRNTAYPISVYFNPAGIPISQVNVRLTFSNLGITASNIQINPILAASTDWTCPVKSVSATGSTGQIDITCTNSSPSGFTASADTLLATFNLTATEIPVINPLILSFDPQISTITQKSDGSDVLLIPTATGSFTITEAVAQSPTASPILVVASPTATPLGATLVPSATPTATATATASPLALAPLTPTPFPTVTPVSTASGIATAPPIPVTGFDIPTIIGVAGGIILLLTGLAIFII